MELVSKYLEFKIVGRKPKTNVYQVLSRQHGDVLGIIKWYPYWRQYCFFPEEETLFNAGCLTDITNFLNNVNKNHYNQRGLRKVK